MIAANSEMRGRNICLAGEVVFDYLTD